MRIFFFAFTSFLLIAISSYSQKGVTLAGIQVKPIFPLTFLGTGTITNDIADIQFRTDLNSGFSFGMVIRHNFTDLLAIETGINYVRRKYSLEIKDTTFTGNSTFRIINYEIPAVFMVYSQLGEKIYVNGSLGGTLNMFPTSLQTFDIYYNHVAFRNHVFVPAITGNIGFEYRTKKSGIIYIGATYQRPFEFIYLSAVEYYGDPDDIVVYNELIGRYLTIDLRFFFPHHKGTKRNDD